jgi:hypothetical protein
MLSTMNICLRPRGPKTSEQLLRDLVFNTNGFHLPPDATFGTPTAFQPLPGDPWQADTFVEVSMPQGCWRPVKGSRTLYYRRMNMANLQGLVGATLNLPEAPFLLSSQLAAINAYYGINLAAPDITDITYPEGTTQFVMQANPNSLAWEGQTVLNPLEIGTVISQTDLDGFTAATLS